MTTRAAAPVLPLVLAAGIGFLGGALGGVTFAGGRTPLPPAGSQATDLGAVVHELRALRQELRRSTPSSGAAADTEPAQRETAPTGQEAASTAELQATVAQLVQAIEALTTRADVLGMQQAGGTGVLQRVAGSAARDVTSLVTVARAVNADHEAAQAQWMFVPATEILRRFGRPSRISSGKASGMLWEYEFAGEGESWWLGFTIADGVVVRID